MVRAQGCDLVSGRRGRDEASRARRTFDVARVHYITFARVLGWYNTCEVLFTTCIRRHYFQSSSPPLRSILRLVA